MSENKRYKLGIMSSVWYVTAPNVDVATLALILDLKTSAPIANYTSNDDGSQEQSRFMTAGLDGDLTEKIGEFLSSDTNVEAVKRAVKTIQEVGT